MNVQELAQKYKTNTIGSVLSPQGNAPMSVTDLVNKYKNSSSSGSIGDFLATGKGNISDFMSPLSSGTNMSIEDSTPTQSKVDVLSNLGKVAEAPISSEIGLGNDIAAAIGGNTMMGSFNKLAKSDQQYLSTIISLKQKAVASGNTDEVSHFQNLIKNYKTTDGISATDIFPALEKSNEQVLGDIGGTALDFAGAGELSDTGKALGTAADVATEAKKGATLVDRLVQGAKTGAKYGAGYGVAGGMQQNESAGNVAISGVEGAAAGAVVGAGADSIFGKKAMSDKDVIDEIAPKLPPTKMNKALATGKVENTQSKILGSVEADFSKDPHLQQVAQDTKEYIQKGTATQNLNRLRAGIEDVAGKVRSFFSEKPVPTNFEDFINKMKMVTPDSTLKKGTPEYATFRDVGNKIIDAVGNYMKGISEKTGEYGSKTNMANYWDSRISLDQTAKAELGDKVFGTPQYTGAKAAVAKYRQAFSDFMTDSIQFPGKMEQVNKMQDFLQEFRARGNQIPSEDEAIQILKKQFGLSGTSEDAARAAYLRDQMGKMSSMYEATDNIAPKARGEQGTNRFSRFAKKYPGTVNALKTTAKYTGIGALLGLGAEGVNEIAKDTGL